MSKFSAAKMAGKFSGADALFGNSITENDITELPVTDLHSFTNHPFKVLDNEEMNDLVESIKENGVLTPVLVRKRAEGGYELISGHRRKRACEIAGLKTIPAVVRELDDDDATKLMVAANKQREHILPSEKAFAYKMEREALKHQGKKIEDEQEIVGSEGENRRTVYRYISLTNLIPELLEMVDAGTVGFFAGSSLSYLKEEEQGWVLQSLKDGCKISTAQADALKKMSSDPEQELTEAGVVKLLAGITEKAKPRKFTMKSKSLDKYFNPSYSEEDVERIIYELLDKWKSEQDAEEDV